MKKKIGILTFHKGPNYGGFLQAWHMREAVRRLGFDADVINYQNPRHFISEQLKFPRKPLPRAIWNWWKRNQKSAPFPAFVDALSSRPFTTDASTIDWNSYDTVLVGSDVIWDFTSEQFGHDPAYFCAHPSQIGARFVSYAASCGPADLTNIPNYVSVGLANFTHIGVRDDTTADLVTGILGQTPELVVDPTWLQEDPPSLSKRLPIRPYALVYGGALFNRSRDEALGEWAKSAGLDVVAAASPARCATKSYSRLTPFEWSDLFRNAEVICTATLHGLLYAIKFEKPFIMVNLSRASSKSRTVIQRLGLTDRVLEPNKQVDKDTLHRIMETPMPDNRVSRLKWIKESQEFLSKSLNES
jgi:polysaccharide pyruvyl transferase WcaK-like protein